MWDNTLTEIVIISNFEKSQSGLISNRILRVNLFFNSVEGFVNYILLQM